MVELRLLLVHRATVATVAGSNPAGANIFLFTSYGARVAAPVPSNILFYFGLLLIILGVARAFIAGGVWVELPKFQKIVKFLTFLPQ